ncbi:MAG TPA: MotA/TolQ/ExbB proton channel family protein [Woeseiaceae bacterium]|nr:MotA/TolQ/ExbB proton channel family protein [Woeseiaceae bacterium]
MKLVRVLTLLIIAGGSAALGGAVYAQDSTQALNELLQSVRDQGRETAAENRRREQEFLQKRNEQKAILDRTRTAVSAEQRRSQVLKQQFDDNERELEELSETLRIRIGDMGELFGVVRQLAGDTKGTIESSLTSAQFKDRSAVANRLAEAKALPSIDDLRGLQALLLEEMIESGNVVRFETEVEDAAGLKSQQEVVRIGVFNAINETGFLSFESSDGSLRELPRPPADRFVNLAQDFFDAGPGSAAMAIDPSRGVLLSLVIQTPSLGETVKQGGAVGYVILFIGVCGLAISFYRMFVLNRISRRVRRQLNDSEVSTDNPLGRVLAVYESNRETSVESLELKMDEAIMRETPKLEAMQGTIKVFAAIAPLMGLLGTVVGMIRTFQTITLFGTGDPKLMAGGISQALVTTVEGLIVAIPLVFLHSVLTANSRALIEILEEQSAGIIARFSERDTGH